MDLNGKKIAILATNGFEQAELEAPRDRLKKSRGGCRRDFACWWRDQRLG
jgi:putative intracellular protease/amidase